MPNGDTNLVQYCSGNADLLLLKAQGTYFSEILSEIQKFHSRERLEYVCHFFQGPLLLTWFNFNPNMDYKHYKVWDEKLLIHSQTLTPWSLWMGNWLYPTLYWACDYLYMLRLKLIYVSKNGPRTQCVMSVSTSLLPQLNEWSLGMYK